MLGWCYRAKGWETDPNAYVYIVIQQSQKGFENFCNAMGFQDWLTDPKFSTPNVGENNEEILKSLGYTDEQIADLATKGVIGSNDGVKADLTAAPAQA